jgi:predicted PurR-regulated permease PerM
LNPVVNTLELRLQRRWPAVMITVTGCAVILGAALLVLIVVGGREISSLRDLVQQFASRGANWPSGMSLPDRIDAYIQSVESPTLQWVARRVQEVFSSIKPEDIDVPVLARRILDRIAPSLAQLAGGVLSVVFGLAGLVVVAIYLVFLLLDYPRMAKSWQSFLPPQYRDDIVAFTEELRLAMSQYFRGQLVISLVLGVVFAIGFSLIGLRLAVLFGLTVGLLAMVPYLQAVALIPALLLAAVRALETDGRVWVSMALVLVVFGLAQIVQDIVLTPRIMGRSTGLRPVIIMLSVFVWGKLLGFLGLLLAIPLTCVGLAYYRRFVLREGRQCPGSPSP